MNVAVPVAMFLIGSTLYLLAAVRWPQHVPLPGWVERLPAPPVLRLPRRKTQAPPRAHGGAGEPRTTLQGRDETGARRLTIRGRAARILMPATGCHARELQPAPVIIRRPEFRQTGPLQITGGRPYVREMTRYLP